MQSFSDRGDSKRDSGDSLPLETKDCPHLLFFSSFPTYLSYSLAEYFTTTGSEGLHNHQQQGLQRENHTDGGIGLTFTNPTALSFELQSNPSYNQPLPSLPPPPPSSTEKPQTNSDLGATIANEGQRLSSSVMIADNPQYRQFSSSNQPHNNSAGGVARVVMSAEVTESEYDYPATFRVSAADNGPYSHVRNTADQNQDPPYATVT